MLPTHLAQVPPPHLCSHADPCPRAIPPQPQVSSCLLGGGLFFAQLLKPSAVAYGLQHSLCCHCAQLTPTKAHVSALLAPQNELGRQAWCWHLCAGGRGSPGSGAVVRVSLRPAGACSLWSSSDRRSWQAEWSLLMSPSGTAPECCPFYPHSPGP